MRLIGIVLTLGALAVAAPAAAKPPKTPKATFKVTLTGTQTNTWNYDINDPVDHGDQRCNVHRQGSGSERIEFSTPAPLKARIERAKYHRRPIPRIRFASGDESFPVTARIERSADVQPATDSCTGEQTPPYDRPPDCGTRTVSWRVFLAPSYLDREQVWVSNDYRVSQEDPFQTCEYAGIVFPVMVESRDVGDRLKLITGPLSTRKLFNRHVKHLSVDGGGSQRDSDLADGVHSLTELSWHVKLDRVR
jgi:hypothetical protein